MNRSNNENAFFSVLIPVYNKAPYLQRSITSVLNQKFLNFELLIIDDASTDSSRDEIQKYTDPRIRIFHRNKPGPGGYAARNLGIKEAKADWICFLDADDEWFENHLEEIFRNIQHDIDIVTNGFVTDSDVKFSISTSKKLKPFEALKYLLSEKNCLNTNTVAIRKSILVSAGMFPEEIARRGGDTDTWLRSIIISRNIYASNVVTSLYHIQASGVVANKSNLDFHHPLENTVRTLLKDTSKQFSSEEKRLLKKISNSKSLSWIMECKLNNSFRFTQLKNLYIEALSARDLRRILALLIPTKILQWLISIS